MPNLEIYICLCSKTQVEHPKTMKELKREIIQILAFLLFKGSLYINFLSLDFRILQQYFVLMHTINQICGKFSFIKLRDVILNRLLDKFDGFISDHYPQELCESICVHGNGIYIKYKYKSKYKLLSKKC